MEAENIRAVETVFSKLVGLGYDGVELSIEEPDRTRVREILKISDDYGLGIPAIGTGLIYGYKNLSLSEVEELRRKKTVKMMMKTIQIAASLDSLVIVGLVRGRIRSDPKRRITEFKRSMKEIDDAAERSGVKLALEPLNRYEANYINNVEEALIFLSSTKLRNTGLLLDTFHMNIEERSFQDAIRKARRKLIHIHVADSNRLAPGLGHIPFREIIRTAAAEGYGRYLSAEVMTSPDPIESARSTIGSLRRMIDGK